MKRSYLALLALFILALSGCATGPRYDTRQVDLALTPSQVAASHAAQSGARVVWGGVIIITRNEPGYTEMEILSYPLDSAQRPDSSRGEQGRFLARYPGYLEGVDYAPGRLITLTGTIDKTIAGKVGESPYTFPVIRADNVYLWPLDSSAPSSSTRFHFGVGVILH